MRNLIFLISLSAFGAQIIPDNGRLQIDPAKRMVLQMRADSNAPEWVAFRNSICPGMPYRGPSYGTMYAEGFALMYDIDRQPCGGTRDAYAQLAIQYAAAIIPQQMAQSLPGAGAITDITNAPIPTVTLAVPHNLRIGTPITTMAIAGGMGSWAMLNNQVSFTPTGPNTGTISCSGSVITPCTVNTSNSGVYTGQRITLFASQASLVGQNQLRWYGRILARSYHWANPGALRVDEYYTVRNTLMFISLYVADAPDNRGCNLISGYSSNLCTGSVSAALFAAIALGNEWSEPGTWDQSTTTAYPDAQDIFDDLRNHYVSTAIPLLTTGGMKGGAFHEGPEYSPQTITAHIEMLEAILTGTTENLFPMVDSWMSNVVQFTIHQTSPKQNPLTGRYEPIPFSDILDGNKNRLLPDYFEGMQRLAEHASAPFNGYAQHWVNTIGRSIDLTDEQKFTRIMPTAVPFSEMPTDFDETGIGFIIGRSSWNPEATWIFGQLGANSGSHVHASRGAIGIYRNGQWLMRHRDGYAAGYVDHGVYPIPYFTRAERVASGGSPPATDAGVLTKDRFLSTPQSLHVRFDMRPAFLYTGFGATASPIVAAYRDIFWIKPDVLLVNDRAQYTINEYAAFSAIFETAPQINGSTATYTTSSQAIDLNVFPSSTLLTTPLSMRPFPLIKRGFLTELCWDSSNTAFPSSITLSGASGAWSALNASHIVTPLSIYSGKTNSCGLIAVDSRNFPEPLDQNVIQSGFQRTLQGNYSKVYWRAPVGQNPYSLQVYTLRNATAAPIPVTQLSVTQGSFQGVQFLSHVVLTPTTIAAASLPAYQYAPSGRIQHHVVGLQPEQDYLCNVEVPGRVIIEAGIGCHSNAVGVLEFETISYTARPNRAEISIRLTGPRQDFPLPDTVGAVSIFRNGLRQTSEVDYRIVGSTVTFLSPLVSGDLIVLAYEY